MADQHDACDEVRKWRRSCQQKPCGFAAALGRRKSVAHNSTGPTSVSIDLEIRKGSWGSAGGSIEATEQAWLGKPLHPVCRAAKALPWGHLPSIRDAVLLRPVDAFSLRR